MKQTSVSQSCENHHLMKHKPKRENILSISNQSIGIQCSIEELHCDASVQTEISNPQNLDLR